MSGLCVWFMSAHVDIPHLLAALQLMHYGMLLPVIGLLIAMLWLRAWRWRYLMAPVKRIGTMDLLSATAIGFLANMLLPAHAGEVVRAYVLVRKHQASFIASMTTIMVERVMDAFSIPLVLMGALAIWGVPVEMQRLVPGLTFWPTMLLLLGVFAGGVLLIMVCKVGSTSRLLQWGVSRLPATWQPRVQRTLVLGTLGLVGFTPGRQLLAMGVLSVLLWAGQILSNFLILLAFDLQLPAYTATVILVMQAVSVAVPSLPGFIGTYHAAVVAGLALFGIGQELGLSVAVMMHAAFFFPLIGLGLGCLWRENLSWYDLRTAPSPASVEAAPPQPRA